MSRQWVNPVTGIEQKKGREFTLTIEKARRFYRAILDGNTLTAASALIGKNKDVVNKWRADGAKHAEECQYEELVDCTTNCHPTDAAKRRFHINVRRAIAMKEGVLVSRVYNATRLPQNGTLALEVLARQNPTEWGKKSELSVKHSGQVKHKSTVQLEPEQLNKMADFLRLKAQMQLNAATIEDGNAEEAEIVD